ncbi:M1 family metallopeptidase [Rubricoccus marinus]|nr:M1 family metallopeptidase [Rubricoccus marinus]
MMKPLRLATLLLLASGAGSALAPEAAAQERPRPYPVMPPPAFEKAVANGTRTASGEPGPNYWQNGGAYDIDVTLEPETRTVRGTGTMTYINRSPDALPTLLVKLRQNLHAPGVPRNRPAEVTGGVTLSGLSLGGMDLTQATGRMEPGQYSIDGTILTIRLPQPLAPGSSLDLDVAWHYALATVEGGTFRQGTDDEVYYVGYWYPQFAMYDDVVGWHDDPYLGNGEHYMPFSDYRVSITAPEDFIMYATGELENPEAVLTDETRGRLERALLKDDIVHVVRADERGSATRDASGDVLTWEFTATNIRDFAFAGSDKYVWDATRANVDQDGDGTPEAVLINALYRPGAESPYDAPWERSAEFSAFSIEHLSEILWPYPWPHMTAVEGIIGGGMEFPMMTLIGGNRTDSRLFGVTYHEIAHMWYPMMTQQDEKSFTWMDEGLTSFNTNEGREAFFDGSADGRPFEDAWARENQGHYRLAGSGAAVEPMRHNDRYPLGTPARGTASYSTPAVLLHAMEDLFGYDAFWSAYRDYGTTWAFKHPYPYDLMNSFEADLGQDLDWLWTPTLFETWTVDVAIASVESTASGVIVTVQDKDLAPMPVRVTVTYAGGTVQEQTVPVQTWLSGAREAVLTFPAGEVTRVELPSDTILDIDPSDNVYTPAM